MSQSVLIPHPGDGRTGDISGMGIGLYVVKEIATLHGGTVTVESTKGAGSTFTVCLPVDERATSVECAPNS